jgi:membrane protease subunit (stomatin/prohibitin family)
MGLFGKIKSEFIEVIEWVDDTPDTLVYRYPFYNKQIKMGATLIVRESQKAIFVDQGKIADIYAPGTYKLTTENMPILTTLRYWTHGFNSPFKTDIFYFNTRQFVDLKWGTPNAVTVKDPDLGALRIRAFGVYTFRASDPEKVMKQISGTEAAYKVSRIEGQLRQTIVSKFSDFFAESKVPFVDAAANLNEFSDKLKIVVAPEFEQFGLELDRFVIENISVPPEIEKILDKKAGMKHVGSDVDAYTKFQIGDSIKDAAQSAGGAAGAGVGAGMGFAMGDSILKSMKSKEGEPSKIMVKCTKCDALNSEQAKFCSQCGASLGKKKK